MVKRYKNVDQEEEAEVEKLLLSQENPLKNESFISAKAVKIPEFFDDGSISNTKKVMKSTDLQPLS